MRSHLMRGRVSVETAALWCVAVAAAATLWIPRYPPMIDLPQHAAEIRMLHDLVVGDFAWGRQLHLNWFTPYLVGSTAGALLTCVMPAVYATKLVWSLAMLGTLHATRRLRRLFDGDPRWDWLVLPGLFGTTFMWGLYPFMTAVPLALYTLVRWLEYLRAPSLRGGLILAALLVGMFFSHLLATAWLMSVGGIALVATAIKDRWRLPQLVVRGLPLLTALPLVVVWWILPKTSAPEIPSPTAWEFGWNRLTELFPVMFGIIGSRVAVAVGVALFALPFACGARLTRDPVALAPLVVTALIVAFVPHVLFNNAYTYNRFYLLLGPAVVIAFAQAPREPGRLTRARILVPILATCWVALMGARMALFAGESADFSELVDRMPEHQRVLGIVLAPRSKAADLSRPYLHFPVWYGAERGGFVDMSFAAMAPSVIQVRPDYPPPIAPGFEFAPTIDWKKNRIWEFDTFLVRVPDAEDPKPPLRGMSVRVADHVGTWWRYDVVDRRDQSAP